MGKRKTTWSDIYKDFKRTHPTRSKGVMGFKPYSFGTILLYFPNGKKMLYNHDTGKLCDFASE